MKHESRTFAEILLADLEQLHTLELLRSNSVERFAMTPMTRNQTIAAHQWEVAMLFIKISGYIGKPFPLTGNSEWVLTGILLSSIHDIAEVFTGDIPSPAKTAYSLTVNTKLPYWAQGMMDAWKHGGQTHEDDLIIKVVKLCDVVSTWWWAAQFGNSGDAYTKSMVRNLENDMYKRLRSVAAHAHKMGYSIDPEWYVFPDELEKGTARTIFDLVEEEDDNE